MLWIPGVVYLRSEDRASLTQRRRDSSVRVFPFYLNARKPGAAKVLKWNLKWGSLSTGMTDFLSARTVWLQRCLSGKKYLAGMRYPWSVGFMDSAMRPRIYCGKHKHQTSHEVGHKSCWAGGRPLNVAEFAQTGLRCKTRLICLNLHSLEIGRQVNRQLLFYGKSRSNEMTVHFPCILLCHGRLPVPMSLGRTLMSLLALRQCTASYCSEHMPRTYTENVSENGNVNLSLCLIKHLAMKTHEDAEELFRTYIISTGHAVA